MYQIELLKSAVKEFRNLETVIMLKMRETIDKLVENPRPHGVKKLKGQTDLYRVRCGDYRIVYRVLDSEKKVIITRIRHRRDVYD